MKKTIALALALALALAAFLACSKEAGSEAAQESPGASEKADDAEAGELPDLPNKTYGGRELVIAAASETLWGNELICPESETGDLVDDATFRRTKTVEDLFDLSLAQLDIHFLEFESKVKNSVNAGDKTFDFIFPRSSHALNLARDGYLFDLGHMPHIDPKRSWWDHAIVRDLPLKGKIFFLAGDINMYAYDGTFVMAFNKNIHQQLGLENLYDAVSEGKWTVDKLDTVMRAAVKDLDGDGKMTFEDQFGMYANDIHAVISFLTAFDCNAFEKISDSEISFDITRPKFSAAIDKINHLMNDGDAVFDGTNSAKWKLPSSEWNYAQKVFSDGRALFMHQVLDTARMNRGMDDDFGMLPVPKFDESQKEYYSPVINDVYVVAVAASLPAEEAEMIGGVIEAMAYEGKRQILPAYYDKTLVYKNTRDDESKGMLDIIFSQRRYSLDETYNFGGIKEKIYMMVRANKNELASLSEKNAEAIQKEIDRLLDKYAERD